MKPSFILTLTFSGVVFALVLDLLGFLPLIAVLSFLLICASIGKLIESIDYKGRFNVLQNLNPSLRFCFLCVLGMQVVALVMLACRLFSIWEIPVLVALTAGGLISGAIYLVKKRNVLFKIDTWSFLGTRNAVLVILLVLVSLLFISDYMVLNEQAYYLSDPHHPIYELSVARATDLSVPPIDLSYQGKPLKFHLASSFLTSALYRYFKIDPLQVVYRVFPLLSIILFIPLLIYLLKLCNVRQGLLSVGVLCVLFAFPFVVPLPSRLAAFAASPNVLRNLSTTPSYTMGYLGFLAALIAVIELIKRRRLFSLTVCILSAGLFMSKGSFFIPLVLGIGLWSLFNCLKNKTLRPLFLPLSIFAVSVPFSPLLAGAHQHNQWLLAPDRLIWAGLPNWVPLSDSILSLPLMFLASPFLFYGLLAIVYVFAFRYVWKYRKESSQSVIMLVTIVMLVGSSVPLFVSEATEANSRQFLYPSFLLLWVLFFRWFSSIKMPRSRQWLFGGILLCSLISQQIAFKMLKPTVLDADKFQLPKAAQLKVAITSPLVHFYTQVLHQKITPTSPSYDFELADALRYIKDNSNQDDVLLIGRHYEFPGWREREYIGEWESSSFFRTAMSGRQTVIEEFKYRGIGMEPNYNQRSIENLRFYYLLVEHTEESLKGWHVEKGYKPSPLLEESQANLPYVRPLWLGGDNNWFVIRQSFPKFLESNWNEVIGWDSKDNESREWLSEYLAKHQVSFILFERGERPRKDLAEPLGLNLVFEKGNVVVYERQKL